MDSVKIALALCLAGALGLFVLAGGCVQQDYHSQIATNAIVACKDLCQNARAGGADLSSGPCLGNPLQEIKPQWVCDIAHLPRIASDNLPENQCSAFREGKANNFVELDENCGLIVAYE